MIFKKYLNQIIVWQRAGVETDKTLWCWSTRTVLYYIVHFYGSWSILSMWRKWWNVFLAKIWIQDYLDHHYHRRYHAWKRPTTRMPFVMVKLAFLKTNDCAFYGIQLRQDVVLLKEGNFDLTWNALEIAVTLFTKQKSIAPLARLSNEILWILVS